MSRCAGGFRYSGWFLALLFGGMPSSLGCASGASKDREQNTDPMGMGGGSGSSAAAQGGHDANSRTGGAPGTTARNSGGTKATGGVPGSGGRSATGGSRATGGTSTSGSLNPPITGSEGFATRYWD